MNVNIAVIDRKLLKRNLKSLLDGVSTSKNMFGYS